MTPARVPSAVTGALPQRVAEAHVAASASGIDPLLVLSVVAILVAVGIAVWQYCIARGYRKIDKANDAERAQQEAQRAEEEALLRRRQANRESWESVYQECHDLLSKLEDVESEARDQGPLTRDQIDMAELGRMQRRLENVSTRCPAALSEPLREVAVAVGNFRSVQILSDSEVTKEYDNRTASIPEGDSVPLIAATEIGATAIVQYRAAKNLHRVICDAWKAINTERGESLTSSLGRYFRSTWHALGGSLSRSHQPLARRRTCLSPASLTGVRRPGRRPDAADR